MIKPKEKKCFGTGIAKGHGCGTPQLERVYGLGKKCGCYPKWLYTSNEGKEKLNRAIIQVQKPRIELEKAEAENKERKSLGWKLQNTKNVCHEYIRLRDKNKPCISCDAPWRPDFQAGHMYKAELFSTLRFDEKNISGQCQGCNIFNDGNESGYRVGILNRYGNDHLEYLDKIALTEKQSDHKWDRAILDEITKYYRGKIKELQQS